MKLLVAVAQRSKSARERHLQWYTALPPSMSRVRYRLEAEMNACGTETESRMGLLGLNAYDSEPVGAVQCELGGVEGGASG